MYPSELELKKESILTSEASSLNLQNNNYEGEIFHKRDAFPLSKVRMPHLDSNVPSNVYKESIGFEILRFARTMSDSNTFITLSN